MRKILLAAIMAASALVPAAAFAQNDDHGRGGWRQQREARGGDQPRPQPQMRQEAPRQFQQPQAQQPQPRFERPQGGNFQRGGGQPDFRRFDRGQAPAQIQQGQPQGDWQGRRWGGRPQQAQQPVIAPQAQQPQQGWRQDRRDGRPDQRADGRWQGDRGGDWRGNDGRRRNDGRRDDWRGNDGHRYDNHGGNWNRNWRNDNRYDWNRARRYNRENFHLPRYYAPYGWDYGYRRFSIGFRLSSILFGQNYWIDDPYYYDLPPAYGPYRWVRYYNDALLVDIYTGEVVDTVYDIFW
ncbi:MAG: RcnB family protein [Sphingomonas sp.]|jgi:Ni/Co efflux regulator RcnB|uniref:RcnB family protein n=1 Tax=Sphingomonas sp. TaxID=28214 RepID=UPI00356AE57E